MNEEEIKKVIIYPVRYEPMGQYIFDAKDNVVANIRGWGRIQYLPKPEETQDTIGEYIAQAINEKLSKPIDQGRQEIKDKILALMKKAEYDDTYTLAKIFQELLDIFNTKN